MRLELEVATSDEEKEALEKSYRMWEWTYPSATTGKTETLLKKARLKKKIEELQEAYDQLD